MGAVKRLADCDDSRVCNDLAYRSQAFEFCIGQWDIHRSHIELVRVIPRPSLELLVDRAAFAGCRWRRRRVAGGEEDHRKQNDESFHGVPLRRLTPVALPACLKTLDRSKQ